MKEPVIEAKLMSDNRVYVVERLISDHVEEIEVINNVYTNLEILEDKN